MVLYSLFPVLFDILGIVLMLVFSRRFSVGIDHIKEVFRKAQEGDLSVKAEISKLDELEQVSGELNSLIKQFHDFLTSVHQSTEEVKHLTNTVKDTANETANAANEISSSSESVAKGAAQQAGNAEECSNVVNELIQKVEHVSRSAEVMGQKADTVQEMADMGMQNIRELTEKSIQSENNISEIIQKINELSSMAQNIGKITEAITGISSQTNLLSLNASIEAAHAGEMGRGFAVVAGEIKKLADQSLKSSQEISKIISGIQLQVKLTTETITSTMENIHTQAKSVHKTSEAFNSIINAIKGLYEQLVIVRDGINNLADHKVKLSENIVNIAAVAEETAASTEEMYSLMYTQTTSGEVLVQLSENLESLIKNLDAKIKRFNFSRITTSRNSFAILPCVDIPFFEDTRQGAMDIGKKLGIDIIYNPPKTFESKELIKIFSEMVELGVKGIAVMPADTPEFREVVEDAQKKGINVVFFESDLANSKRRGFIGTDNVKAGKMAGEIIVKAIGGKGTLIVSMMNPRQASLMQRLEGVKSVIGKYTDIKLLEIEGSGISDVGGRWKGMKSVLQKYPGLDCLVILDCDGPLYVNKIRSELGFKSKIIVFDKTKEAIDLIKKGEIYAAIAQRPKQWGELSVKRLNELMLGRQIPSYEDTGTFEINRNNVSTF